jgi:hypothetical protein
MLGHPQNEVKELWQPQWPPGKRLVHPANKMKKCAALAATQETGKAHPTEAEAMAPSIRDGEMVVATMAAQEMARMAPKAGGAVLTVTEAGEPLMKTCGEGKPLMAALMLLLLLAARLIPIELDHKTAAPLDALQNPGRADDGRRDGKKMRADSPAIIDYVCIIKTCKMVGGNELAMGSWGSKV